MRRKRQIVKVKFESWGKWKDYEYSYFTDLSLNVEDLVVVDGGGVLKVVIISKINVSKEDGRHAAKWVIQKVDDSLIKLAEKKEKNG